MSFDFVDLFSGVGGFHGALSAMGGTGVLASEIDPFAAEVYDLNWGLKPEGDVVEVAAQAEVLVPEHALLAGGFPCQPFSKGGHQRGMSEIRGQMVNEILKILAVRKPAVVFLENVRNLAGPRQRPVWNAVIQGLREAGYRVPSEPAVFSPHLLPPQFGGSPQNRERVYILGTYVGVERARRETDVEPVLLAKPVAGWDPGRWSIADDVLQAGVEGAGVYSLQPDELEWVRVWNDFLQTVRPAKLPGFPMWSGYWHADASVDQAAPEWKQVFERKNITFYRDHRMAIDRWLRRNPQLRSFPASRQKLEWQAGDGPVRDLTKCLLHFRPSGIRAKQPTYAPALVAMAQTPVYGPLGRRLTPRETARLQGFPDWFDFGDQPDAKSYKQMGNAIHIGAAYYALKRHVAANHKDIARAEGGAELVAAVTNSPQYPEVRPKHA
ncbi:DNA (cytosine-5-)-methyltransferase [Knoellia sp. CPCC 206450]|uniref:DNA (cytosine-5-)-methyltransferase n=1 Tax=Knoellia tibetensis TaxID=3404798 RepID=UPI003B439419